MAHELNNPTAVARQASGAAQDLHCHNSSGPSLRSAKRNFRANSTNFIAKLEEDARGKGKEAELSSIRLPAAISNKR